MWGKIYEIIKKNRNNCPFFDLLHRLLSFVTQFKYISLSIPSDEDEDDDEDVEVSERDTNNETDRYKTNYTNLVKRIALRWASTVSCICDMCGSIRAFKLRMWLKSCWRDTHMYHDIIMKLWKIFSLSFFLIRVWLICFIFKLIWIDLNLFWEWNNIILICFWWNYCI